MLIQFSVGNFLSFDEEQIFSMVAAGGDQHPSHLVPNVPRQGEAVLRIAALYGANGAGKSNLVQAMQFAKSLIIEGTRGREAIPVRPFKLGKDAGRPSKFEFTFTAQGVLYNYGFRLDKVSVQEEWLFATPKSREVLLFQRALEPDGKNEFEFGAALTGRAKKRAQFLEFVAEGTRPNQLFLSEALQRNVTEIQPVIEWFQKSLLILSAETPAVHLEMNVHEDEALTAFLQAVLQATGTGVEQVKTREAVFDMERLPAAMFMAREQLEAQLKAADAVTLNVYGPKEERLTLKRGADNKIVQVLLQMLHRGKEGQLVELSMEEESDGTQRIANLVPALFLLKQNPDQVLVIDELDRRLHPFLSRFFVQAAIDGDQLQSNLIFTTHDANLLDLDLLRRDEVWFVEKDNGGASHLYSLVEFKTRPDLKIEKGYLSGRFGAVPFVKEVHTLRVPQDLVSAPA